MIDFKNLGQYLMPLVIPGTLTTGTVKDFAIVPFNGIIRNIVATVCTTAAGTTTAIIDINKNGTTIFSSTKLNFATTDSTVTLGALTTDPTPVSAGDKISIDCDAAGPGPSGVYVGILIDKTEKNAMSTITDLSSLR